MAQDRTDRTVAMLVPGGFEHAGGIGRWASYLHAAWIEQGLHPALTVMDTRGSGGAGSGAAAFLRALVRLFLLRLQGRLGLIHANLSARGSTARKMIVGRLARLLRVPFVLHLHGSGYHEFYAALPSTLQAAIRATFASAAEVIVLGEFWADWVATTLLVPRAKITILRNGVPRPARERNESRERPPHIVLLGRLGERKGVPELLEALASGVMQGLLWRATLAGDGDLALWRARAARLLLSDRVTLPGWLGADATSALLAEADILVLPSHAENSPMSVIEALAYGVAVVVTPVGTTPELLRDGESAMFVPVGDAVALAGTLARLLREPELRRRIGRGGFAVWQAKLDINLLARQLAGLYGSAVRH